MNLLQPGTKYRIAVWISLDPLGSYDTAPVQLTVKQTDDAGSRYFQLQSAQAFRHAGKPWIQLSGHFTYQPVGAVQELLFYVEASPAQVSFLVDDAIVEDWDHWRAQATARINAIRKRDFTIQVLDHMGTPVAGVQVHRKLVRHEFGFGTAVSTLAANNPGYDTFLRQDFSSYFNWATFENETKWCYNEPDVNPASPGNRLPCGHDPSHSVDVVRGGVSFDDADDFLSRYFVDPAAVYLRGHALVWGQSPWVQTWLTRLTGSPSLEAATQVRIDQAVGHFRGVTKHWDVNNEMFHQDWFAEHIPPSSAWMFKRARALDPDALLFVNDYDVLEACGPSAPLDSNAPDSFISKLNDLIEDAAPIDGIGLQAHYGVRTFNQNGATMLFNSPETISPTELWGRLDDVASATSQIPIWITEYDSYGSSETQLADNLDVLYTTAFSHPQVKGVVMWGFWAGSHWRADSSSFANVSPTTAERVAMIRQNWTLNAAGQRYDQLIRNEWIIDASSLTDSSGRIAFRGFYGAYSITLPDWPGVGAGQVTLQPGSGAYVHQIELPSCDDSNPCTLDGTTASECVHSLRPVGASCDDGNACTQSDVCDGAGSCAGSGTVELCDGLDNDCDGLVDEALGTTTCGIGECRRAVQNCSSGVPQTCIPGAPTVEVCDGLDNDCDGRTEGLPDITLTVSEEDACDSTMRASWAVADWSDLGTGSRHLELYWEGELADGFLPDSASYYPVPSCTPNGPPCTYQLRAVNGCGLVGWSSLVHAQNTVIPEAPEVSVLDVVSPEITAGIADFSWSPTPFGGPEVYDLLRSTTGVGINVTCIATQIAGHEASDGVDPGPGQAFFYLVRISQGCLFPGPSGATSGQWLELQFCP